MPSICPKFAFTACVLALVLGSLNLALAESELAQSQTTQPQSAQDQAVSPSILNELIDYEAFESTVAEAGPKRENRRLTEAEFLAMLKQEDVVLLDARSAQRYEQRHIEGAISLPFTEFTAERLAAIIPNPDTPVLIYCNNNFLGDDIAFAAKSPAASLNLSTYTNLLIYGYSNIYELGPLLDVEQTQIPFVGRLVKDK